MRGAVSSFGDSVAKTPHLDNLATTGLRFTNHHVQVSECAPSRVSMLTGLRPDQTQVFGREAVFRRKNRNVVTLPAYFRNLNYTSVALGKVFDTSSFTDSKDFNMEFTDVCPLGTPKTATECSFDVEVPAGRMGVHCPGGSVEFPPIRNPNDLYSIYGESLAVNQTQESEWYDGCTAHHAVARIEEFGRTQTPFFLSVGFLRPHLPWSAPRRFWNKFPRDRTQSIMKTVQLMDIRNPRFFLGQSSGASRRIGWDEIGQWERTRLRRQPTGSRPRAYYVSVSFVDEMIGQVVDAVQQSPHKFVRDNTVIVVWGDNGLHLGPVLWGKKTLFEQATRTPLIVVPSVAWKRRQMATLPGLGKAISHPVESIDIYPTILELTGVPMMAASEGLAGKSLVPYFFDTTRALKVAAVSQYRDQRDQFRMTRMGYAIRTSTHRFIRYFQFDPGCWGSTRDCVFYRTATLARAELYFYSKPGTGETVNLFANSRFRAVRIQMEAIMRNRSVSWSSL